MPLFVTSYASLVVLCTIFGLTFASSFSFTPSILVSLVDLEDFTCAYGLVLLVQGIGIIVGPPLAGVIYDITLRFALTILLTNKNNSKLLFLLTDGMIHFTYLDFLYPFLVSWRT